MVFTFRIKTHHRPTMGCGYDASDGRRIKAHAGCANRKSKKITAVAIVDRGTVRRKTRHERKALWMRCRNRQCDERNDRHGRRGIGSRITLSSDWGCHRCRCSCATANLRAGATGARQAGVRDSRQRSELAQHQHDAAQNCPNRFHRPHLLDALTF